MSVTWALCGFSVRVMDCSRRGLLVYAVPNRESRHSLTERSCVSVCTVSCAIIIAASVAPIQFAQQHQCQLRELTISASHSSARDTIGHVAGELLAVSMYVRFLPDLRHAHLIQDRGVQLTRTEAGQNVSACLTLLVGWVLTRYVWCCRPQFDLAQRISSNTTSDLINTFEHFLRSLDLAKQHHDHLDCHPPYPTHHRLDLEVQLWDPMGIVELFLANPSAMDSTSIALPTTLLPPFDETPFADWLMNPTPAATFPTISASVEVGLAVVDRLTDDLVQELQADRGEALQVDVVDDPARVQQQRWLQWRLWWLTLNLQTQSPLSVAEQDRQVRMFDDVSERMKQPSRILLWILVLTCICSALVLSIAVVPVAVGTYRRRRVVFFSLVELHPRHTSAMLAAGERCNTEIAYACDYDDATGTQVPPMTEAEASTSGSTREPTTENLSARQTVSLQGPASMANMSHPRLSAATNSSGVRRRLPVTLSRVRHPVCAHASTH